MFAVTRIAGVVRAARRAGMRWKTLMSLQAARPGFFRDVENPPAGQRAGVVASDGRGAMRGFYREMQRRVRRDPRVDRVALGSPCRGDGGTSAMLHSAVRGEARERPGRPRGRFRSV